ncbi:MAG TPA: exodeoxyribonuclease VII large subunit [Vicinamibacterales bacterium]|jgi:exodeoxyribonuclease VII large subunit|nr:exodeoxyribonuclease VII large subunit [Vicinamibacterales bacterium]
MSDLFDIPFEDGETQRGAEAQRAVEDEAASSREILTVSELTLAIRQALETRFVEVYVEGELSNCKIWASSGHLYFTLKDSSAQIRGFMYRSALRYLKFKPEDGLKVVARGRISVYDAKGEYQFVTEHLEPQGYGARQLAFEQLKKRLAAEGLFETSRKRPLPLLPRRIGIVTSIDGAALRDIVKVLRRRYPNAHLVIRPTRVQGDGAAVDIKYAIADIGRVPGVDVIIVGRGGGSAEDLWAFNDERVARAIAASPVPIISAVGHEIDVTIADFVADLRAPTPSAAAEMVVARRDEFCAGIDRLRGRLDQAIGRALDARRSRLHTLEGSRGLQRVPSRVALAGRHVAELTHALGRAAGAGLQRRMRGVGALERRLEARDVRRTLAEVRGRLARAERRLSLEAAAARHRADGRFRALAGRLENLSPLAVLARGYAVCWDAARTRVLRRASEVATGDAVRVKLHEGELDCTVNRTRPEDRGTHDARTPKPEARS